MLTIEDVARLTQWVLGAAFLLSVAFGAIVQRTGFCTMGAISDAAALGDWARMRHWALAAAVAVAGFALLAWQGVVAPQQVLYASNRWLWLSAVVGGLVFGFGMVLASGCGSKSLVRIGGGNLKSLVVVLVLGLCAFATLRGLTAVWRVQTVDCAFIEFAGDASLAALLARGTGLAAASASLLAGLAVAAVLGVWALATRGEGDWGKRLGAVGVGACVVAMWWVTGWLGHVAEHPETLQDTILATNSRRAEGLSFVAPVAYAIDWLLFYSDTSKHLTVGIVSVAGVVCGSALVALAQGSFRWEGFGGTSDLGHHLAGAACMGVGGVTALGCTIGQGLSGLSTLSLTSIVALAAMVAGGWGGVRYQEWRLGA